MNVTAGVKPSARVQGAQRVKSAATRAALIAAGRERFGLVGYHGTGTHELVALASVTRGALYHHFGDKKDLFEAAFLQLDEELNRSARAAVASLCVDTWRQLLIAMETYLRLRAENREAQRILLLDGPAVLGWERWRELQESSIQGMVQTLSMLMNQEVIARGSPETLGQGSKTGSCRSPRPGFELLRQLARNKQFSPQHLGLPVCSTTSDLPSPDLGHAKY